MSRSRHVADAMLDGPVSADPCAIELIDEMWVAFDGVAASLAQVVEATAPVDALRVCAALDRVEGRLVAALDAVASRRPRARAGRGTGR